jgi:nucleotide-binding universal stress UspA family protein
MNTILTLNDFSTAAERAVARAVQLACRHGATLELAHLSDSGPPDVAERLLRCAGLLARRHRLRVRQLGALDEDALHERAASRADLLVLGWPAHTPRAWLRERLLGSLPRRLLRRQPLACPLLVVRRPADAAYGHLLVALPPTPEPALRLAEAAATLEPQVRLELFHATSTYGEARLRAAEARPQSLRLYREALQRQAREHLLRVSDALEARRNRLMHTLGRGDPARQALVQQEYGGAELLLGSTAGNLLERAGCDLLIWPEARAPQPAAVCASSQRA